MIPFGYEQNVLHQTGLKKLASKWLGDSHFGVRVRGYYLARSLKSIKDINSILEVGCSRGQTSFWLKRCFPGAYITALDINATLIQHCQTLARRFHASHLDFVTGDILRFHDPQSYDLIVCFDVLEHIVDWQSALIRLASLLKPGGRLLIHTPHKGRFQSETFGLRKYRRAVNLDAAACEHVREGFMIADFRFLDSLSICYTVTCTFGPFTMWLHTLFEVSRTHSWLWQVMLTSIMLPLAKVDAGFVHQDGGGLLIQGIKSDGLTKLAVD